MKIRRNIYKSLENQVSLLQQENQQLKDRINKAIEFIENNTYSSISTMKTILHLESDNLYDLLEILKETE